jgi:hypothetical protein
LHDDNGSAVVVVLMIADLVVDFGGVLILVETADSGTEPSGNTGDIVLRYGLVHAPYCRLDRVVFPVFLSAGGGGDVR